MAIYKVNASPITASAPGSVTETAHSQKLPKQPTEYKRPQLRKTFHPWVRGPLMKLGCGDIAATTVQKLDSIDALGDLQRIGKVVAVQRVKAEHFNFGVFKPQGAVGQPDACLPEFFTRVHVYF